MHSFNEWVVAQSPNYTTNVDKIYPYSEVPFIGQYKLVKLPLDSPYVDLVDYWGEGRIDSEAGVSGFSDCYNINHPHQCVSNGPDRGKKIPNRIPVQSYTTCDSRAYIKDNSVLTVTLKGSPINNSCASDIARMVERTNGKVVIYGFNRNSASVRNLETKLKKNDFILCPDYELPAPLKGCTLFDQINNPSKLKTDLRSYIVSSNYTAAVNLSKSLAFSSYADILNQTVSEMLHESNRNMLSFAYQLWNSDAEIVVSKYFPAIFKLILSESSVKIINKKNLLALKFALKLNSNNTRTAYGDSSDISSERVSWKLQPQWARNRVNFRIMNVNDGMFLTLVVHLNLTRTILFSDPDTRNDMKACGEFSCHENRHAWYLDPVYSHGELLFVIVNAEHGVGLKLDENTDSVGDRELLGHNSSDLHGDPANYGWYIQSWK